MADCKYGDPHCPCQDGDACHYEAYPGSPAVVCVPTEYVRRALDRLQSELVTAKRAQETTARWHGEVLTRAERTEKIVWMWKTTPGNKRTHQWWVLWNTLVDAAKV